MANFYASYPFEAGSGGGGGGTPTGPAGGDLSGTYPDPSVPLLHQNTNSFAAFDNSGDLASAVGWTLDSTGQAQGFLQSVGVDSATSLQVGADISTDLTGGYEGVIVSGSLSAEMNFMSAFNNETNFLSGYDNTGGIESFQDQSNLNAGASIQNFVSYSSTPTLNGTIADGYQGFLSTATANVATTYFEAFSSQLNLNSGFDNSGALIVFNDQNTLASGASTQSYTSFSGNPILNGDITATYVGLSIDPSSSTGSIASVRGIRINLGDVTDDNVQGVVGIESDSRVQINATTELITSEGFQIGSRIENLFHIPLGSPVTGTDSIGINVAGDLEAQDNLAIGPIGLGFNSVGFIASVAVAATKTVDTITVFLPGSSTPDPGFATGGNVTNYHVIRTFPPLNQGGSVNITNLYGFKIDSLFGDFGAFATNAWGICIDSDSSENYFGKSISIGSATKKVPNGDVGLEIGNKKAFMPGQVTTAEKNALTAVPGMMVYDTTLNQMSYYNGTLWVNF